MSLSKALPFLLLLASLVLTACGGSNNDPDPDPDPDPEPKTRQQLIEELCAFDYGCNPDEYESLDECEEIALDDFVWAESYSPDCEQATWDIFECIAGLSTCGELDEYQTPGAPCYDEFDAYWVACD